VADSILGMYAARIVDPSGDETPGAAVRDQRGASAAHASRVVMDTRSPQRATGRGSGWR
jgi:hypothetical protein